ncbi:hypothetical protein BGI32_03345 [Snodgrassella alvi]|uniref:Lysozyme inhibitor LprI-like N-terminal domain-containing protein n=1 Tax=Snodgrassella alvi TaxID=1196083 RepID=A0A2N9WV77_9NEIS|nr:lysozyme inhibitor LprI family protein [Snodgrassella alvi]PIT16862.1 hypothetical protein BGI32_03345 [Snodgrassella alvi]
MKKSILVYSIISVLSLAACSRDDSTSSPQLSCNSEQLRNQIQQTLQTGIDNNARQFAQNDSRQFVDAEKVIGASHELNIALSDGKLDKDSNGNPICSSELKITVPANIWQQIQTNAPLLFGKSDFITHLNQQLQGNEVTLHDSVFTKPVKYAPVASNTNAASATSAASNFDQAGIQTLGTVLGNALLPYGIKDTVVIAGHTYNRADAITLITNPNAKVSPIDQLSPTAQMASAILNGHIPAINSNNQADSSNNAGKISENSSKSTEITANQLQLARDNNRNANSVINTHWRNLDDTVRKTLQQEEQKWIARKNSQCQEKAAKADTPTHAEFLRLECDTQMTNERIKYLSGYALH